LHGTPSDGTPIMQRREASGHSRAIPAQSPAGVRQVASRLAKDTPANVERLGIAALLIFGIALLVRVVHVWQIQSSPVSGLLMGDARSYDAWARQIAGEDWLGKDVFYQAPLYPYFLAVLYQLFDGSLLAVRLCQAVIGAASCALLAGAGCRLFSRRVGIVAGLIMACYAPAVFLDGSIQKSVLDAFFLCWMLYLIGGLLDKPRPTPWVWLGLATGCLTLTRENAAVLVVVFLVWLMLHGRRTAWHRPAFAGLFLCGLAVVILPVAVRNWVVGGEFHLTTSQFGPNFYIGNSERADGTYVPLCVGRGNAQFESQDATKLAEQASGRDLTPGEVSDFWSRRAIEYIATHPADWLGLMARKLALTWNAVEIADSEDEYTYAGWSIPLKATHCVCHFGLVAPLAILGIILTWPQRNRVWVLYLILASFTATIVLFYVLGRYRHPLAPVLVLFAAAGLVGLGPLFRRVSLWRTLGCVAVLVAAAVLCNWPIASTTEMRATTLLNIGNGLAARGQADQAILYYRQSLQLQPSVEARCALANALASRNDLDEAIAFYHQSIQMAPDFVDAIYGLGNALLLQHRPEDAVAQYVQVLRIDPRHSEALYNLAVTMHGMGKLDDATSYYREYLHAAPRNVEAICNLAKALATQGKFDEAAIQYRHALELDAHLPQARLGLGETLSRNGKTAEALPHLMEAIRLKPDSPETMNDVAWIIATQPGWPRETVDEAVRLAAQSCQLTGNRHPGMLDTLAATYAAAGQFDRAQALARTAIEHAAAADNGKLVDDIRTRLTLYAENRAFREEAVPPSNARGVTQR
jgi:tetratricopeptide (TPR) repeat protein